MPKEIINQCEQRMQKTIEALKKDFATIRTGKANPSILNGVMVEYYGSPMPIHQIASISVPEPQMIVIKPYDKSILKGIEKAIQTANLGFNPQNDGDLVRKELVKQAKKLAEDNKIAIRNIRRDAIEQLKKLEKDSIISEDELKRRSDEVQKATDKFIDNIDKLAKEKEQDIMSI